MDGNFYENNRKYVLMIAIMHLPMKKKSTYGTSGGCCSTDGSFFLREIS
jgi:hypothetical protein